MAEQIGLHKLQYFIGIPQCWNELINNMKNNP